MNVILTMVAVIKYVLIKYHCTIVLVSLASDWLMINFVQVYIYLVSTLILTTQTLMSVSKGFLDVFNYVLIPLEAIDVLVSMGTNLELITTHVLVRSLLIIDINMIL